MSSIPSIVPLLPPVLPQLNVGAVAAAVPVALAQQEAFPLPLPGAQALSPAAPAAADPASADGAAMRPDQVFMSRQMHFAAADGQTLATSWRAMLRNYGTQMMQRELRAHAGQLPPAVLAASQDGRVLRQPDSPGLPPPDAWRFTVHAGGPHTQQLRLVTEEPDQPPGRRRRGRAALRLELELADGTRVVVQVEPAPEGLVLELCAADADALDRLRKLEPMLEKAVARAGLRVLRWRYRDTLPAGQVHARLAHTEAAQALTLPVFRAVAELALLLPAQQEEDQDKGAKENFTTPLQAK
jgi:hypothetical protein